MKARAAAARARKKQAGTGSTRAAVRRLAGEGPSKGRSIRENVRQDIKPDLVGKDMAKKRAKRVRRPLRSTQSQTHRAP